MGPGSQAPLQPLQDNLESQTYETFEKDGTKYAQYQAAVHAALLDRPAPANGASTSRLHCSFARLPWQDAWRLLVARTAPAALFNYVCNYECLLEYNFFVAAKLVDKCKGPPLHG